MNGSQRIILRLQPLWAAGLLFAATVAACSDDQSAKDRDAQPDASRIDARPDRALVDAGVDAAPDAIRDAMTSDASDCDPYLGQAQVLRPGELYRLPPTGYEWSDCNLAHEGNWAAYSENRCPIATRQSEDIFIFDMETLTESVAVARLGNQDAREMVGQTLVYSDAYASNFEATKYEIDLFLYDIVTGQKTQLTDGNWGKVRPRYNGTHVVFLGNESYPTETVQDLIIQDIATGNRIILADRSANVERDYSISADYVTWQAKSHNDPTVWDIYDHHISTGVTTALGRDTPYLAGSFVAGNRLVFNESDGSNYDVYVHDLNLDVTDKLIDAPYDQVVTGMRGRLLLYVDYSRSHSTFPSYHYDIVLLDMDTGVSRRLTVQPGGLGASPSCHWLYYAEEYDDWRCGYYAWDLIAAGVLDDQCHVLPCDPDHEQCSMFEWHGR